jgi:hypothetical protein
MKSAPDQGAAYFRNAQIVSAEGKNQTGLREVIAKAAKDETAATRLFDEVEALKAEAAGDAERAKAAEADAAKRAQGTKEK